MRLAAPASKAGWEWLQLQGPGWSSSSSPGVGWAKSLEQTRVTGHRPKSWVGHRQSPAPRPFTPTPLKKSRQQQCRRQWTEAFRQWAKAFPSVSALAPQSWDFWGSLVGPGLLWAQTCGAALREGQSPPPEAWRLSAEPSQTLSGLLLTGLEFSGETLPMGIGQPRRAWHLYGLHPLPPVHPG